MRLVKVICWWDVEQMMNTKPFGVFLQGGPRAWGSMKIIQLIAGWFQITTFDG